MTISDQIRDLCDRLGISIAELARLNGQSPQNFSAKLKRNSFTISDLEKIADSAGIRFVRFFELNDGEKV